MTTSSPSVPTPLTRKQKQALDLLARGGARYGTRYTEMQELLEMGLCYAHDNGKKGKGRWTWRPTEKGWRMIRALSVPAP